MNTKNPTIKECLEWLQYYKVYREEILAVDIESSGYKGHIVLAGLGWHVGGDINYKPLVKYHTLNHSILRTISSRYAGVITHNGLSYDMIRLKKEYPGAVKKEMPVIDIYLIAQALGLPTKLKELEAYLGIRRTPIDYRTHFPIELWKYYWYGKDPKALEELITYNRQDTVNLFKIADKLVEIYLNN